MSILLKRILKETVYKEYQKYQLMNVLQTVNNQWTLQKLIYYSLYKMLDLFNLIKFQSF
jgi:hypothetical protein